MATSNHHTRFRTVNSTRGSETTRPREPGADTMHATAPGEASAIRTGQIT